MLLPAENRGKVGNIVRKQGPQFKELYHRLVVGLPGVRWPMEESMIQQDTSPKARSAHLKKLPKGLLERVKRNYAMRLDNAAELQADEGVYWIHLAGDKGLPPANEHILYSYAQLSGFLLTPVAPADLRSLRPRKIPSASIA
jgi:translocator assembly and maintenance protein 41